VLHFLLSSYASLYSSIILQKIHFLQPFAVLVLTALPHPTASMPQAFSLSAAGCRNLPAQDMVDLTLP